MARARGAGALEGEAYRGKAEPHADEARDQERTAAEAIDEGDRDESRKHIDRADRPGGSCGLRRRRREAGRREDLIGIIDDRVDAGDLLQDCEAQADLQRRPRTRPSTTALRVQRATTPR